MLATEIKALRKLSEVLLGDYGVRIIDIIREKGEITDEELAKILGKDITEVRVMLHKLFDAGILRYRRVKDSQIGWYSYYWYFTDEPVRTLIHQRKNKILRKLEIRLKYEENNSFYICPNRDTPKLTFNEAYNNMFICPVCGSLLEPYDNSQDIEILKKIISRLKNLQV
ncbi:MAG: transcription factor [Thermoprotei archaeon]|nr:MAG: transcription factor [Thermoprotei archaeon]